MAFVHIRFNLLLRLLANALKASNPRELVYINRTAHGIVSKQITGN